MRDAQKWEYGISASHWIILANANLSEYVLTEVQRDGGGMSEMFTVGQAKCITCINSIYPQVGLMISLLYR